MISRHALSHVWPIPSCPLGGNKLTEDGSLSAVYGRILPHNVVAQDSTSLKRCFPILVCLRTRLCLPLL